MKCRSCSSDQVKDVISLGDQYLSEFRENGLPEKAYPINVMLCKNCSLVQLRESTPPELLYNDNYGYYSGINNTIREDLKDIVVSAASMVDLIENDIVIDIGSNDGTLLKNYPKELARIGFDPVRKFAEFYKDEDNLLFINDYFSKEALLRAYKDQGVNRKPKIITAISCFYDLENPNKFVQDIADILHPQGIFVIEQNYLATMIDNLAFDNMVHEHIEYYSLKSLEHLLKRHFLKVVDIKVNGINGGAFRTYIKHMDNIEKMRIIEKKMKLDNQFTYVLMGMKIKKIAKKVHDFIREEVNKGKTVYTYGASTRGNSLLQVCGLDNTLIKAAVERNPVKFGKKFLGIPIISEDQARKEKPDYMLVLPWFFKEEFLKREKEYLKSGGKFIFPLPEFEVVGYETEDS